jgi:hypothetical protein
MNASFEYRLQKGEYAQGLKAIALLLALQDSRFRILLLLGLVSALAFVEWRIPGALPWMLLGIVLYCVVQGINGARQYYSGFDPAAAGYEVSFEADGVVQRNDMREHRWSWHSLRRVEQLPDVIVLQFAGWDWLPLPNRLWTRSDERSEFVSHVRGQAPNIVPARKWSVLGHSKLLLVGAVAFGLNVALSARGLLYLFGIDMCDCTVRRSPLGQTISIVIVIGALIAIPFSVIGLERLRAKWPRLSSTVAAALIVPPALLGVGIALRWLRFF